MIASVLLVALGAVPGASLRLLVVRQLGPRLGARHWATCAVNLSACFVLGLLVGRLGGEGAPSGSRLLLATGFLGSYSTFSGFAAELLALLQGGRPLAALRLGAASLLGGLGAVAAGLALGG